jgi:antitoxin component of MazEF toxin-antitoxin module
MKRRLIELGTRKLSHPNYSYATTLPSIWVKTNGLQQNELLVFHMDENNNLIIRPHRRYVNEKV